MSEHLIDAATIAAVRELIETGLDSRLARQTAMAFRPYYRAGVSGEMSKDAWLLFQPNLHGSEQVEVYLHRFDFENASADLLEHNYLHVGVRLGDALARGEALLKADPDA